MHVHSFLTVDSLNHTGTYIPNQMEQNVFCSVTYGVISGGSGHSIFSKTTLKMDAKEQLAKFLKAKQSKADAVHLDNLASWISSEYGSNLNVAKVKGQTLSWLVVTEAVTSCDNPMRVQLQICSDKTFQTKVLGVIKDEGKIDTMPFQADCELKCILKQLSSREYHICPGIVQYEQYFQQLRYDPKHVRKWGLDKRVDSENCLLWHKPPKNIKEEYAFLCQHCTSLIYHLNTLRKRSVEAGSPKKRASVKASSRRPLKFMSPKSRRKRTINQNQERRELKRLLKKMKGTDIELNDSQHHEMCNIGNIIERDHAKDLDEVIEEAAGYNDSKKKLLSQMWGLDMEDRKLFETDQKRNITGYRGNRWNMITYRIALAVYIRSPGAYKALKSFNVLNLPSKRSLQKFVSHNNDDPGRCDDYLGEQMKKYAAMCEELRKNGKPVPDAFGALIFDEVKVISKILWNSKNNSLIGLAMSPEELSCLHDIYMHVDGNCKRQNTNYILQFLWRDLCSPFDVLGPYYTCYESLEHKFVIACVIDSLRKLHTYGFKTKVVICDGASTNLTAIKYFCGHRGTFSHNLTGGVISHKIQPKVFNPLTEEFMYFIICPTHQMKNVIAQLYASRQGGAKAFEKDGIAFGWQPIREVYNIDVINAQQNNLQQVKGLRLSYVVRDAWTRLNVTPSKIMQQPAMIAAIKILADNTNNAVAKQQITMTANYLDACYKIFETGVLSNYHIRQSSTEVLDRITEGNVFFESWITGLLQQPGGYRATDSKQKKFLAWQTWDLQRIMVYGLQELSNDFIAKYQDNFYLKPKRLNGSAIETLFSQFKFISGGKLSAANYATARAAYLMRVDIHGRHYGEADYRNVPLYLRQWQLMRR